jgi:hypothetical protein
MAESVLNALQDHQMRYKPKQIVQGIYLGFMLIATIMTTACTTFGAKQVVTSHAAYKAWSL